MSDTFLIIALAVGTGLILLLVLFLVDRTRRTRAKRADKRLDLLEQESGILSQGSTIRLAKPEGASARFDQAFVDMVDRTQLNLSVEQALGITALTGIILAGIAYVWKGNLLFTLVLYVLGMLIPLVAFKLLSGRWRKQIQKQLPDAFYLLARSLRSSMSLQQALINAEEQGIAPLKDEWSRVNTSIQLGLPISQALELVAKRVKLVDFDSFVSTVALYERSGGNLSLLLDRLAGNARDRNQFRAQFFATTAQGRITAIILGVALPILLLLYLLSSPDQLEGFLQTPSGWATLFVAIMLQIVGALWIYRILKIEY